MILIDRALAERAQNNNPIRVGLVGAGYSGKTIAYQIQHSFPGIRLVAISNRTLDAARAAFAGAGVTDVRVVKDQAGIEQAIRDGRPAITENASAICQAHGVDVVLEATGTIEYGAGVVVEAVQNGKHIIIMNVELDATLGPILKAYADRFAERRVGQECRS